MCKFTYTYICKKSTYMERTANMCTKYKWPNQQKMIKIIAMVKLLHLNLLLASLEIAHIPTSQ